jgi:hypothetical protein
VLVVLLRARVLGDDCGIHRDQSNLVRSGGIAEKITNGILIAESCQRFSQRLIV